MIGPFELNAVHCGDCLELMKKLPDESVQCCVTSPPYWGLRDYGVKGQLGLEKTPEEYVARMVEIFREVWRVLRKDGTVWLNLGDSYASGKGTCYNPGGNTSSFNVHLKAQNVHPLDRGNKSTLAKSGLKPKDLCMMPSDVARALRQPYYTGKMKNEIDRVWLAAMIDAEGCIFIHKRKAGQSNGQGYFRKNDSYGAGLEVANTNENIVKRCLELTGVGSICSQSPQQNKRRKQTIYRWNVRSKQCLWILREIYPYLVAKKQEARIALGCPSSGPRAELAHASLINIHNGAEAQIDFQAPDSLFEPGYCLRSDIIWNKLNPMPESVTDRPTKSHEYIFLLTKSPRYYYDADAIREESDTIWNSHKQMVGKPLVNQTGGDKRPTQDQSGRNKRTVWTIATHPFPEAHFATYPPKLIEPCVLAGSSEKGACAVCGAPWARVVESERRATRPGRNNILDPTGRANRDPGRHVTKTKTTGWQLACDCNAETVPCVVLDLFMGAGTTGLVAMQLNRDFIGFELNQEYCDLANERIEAARANCTLKQYRAGQRSLF